MEFRSYWKAGIECRYRAHDQRKGKTQISQIGADFFALNLMALEDARPKKGKTRISQIDTDYFALNLIKRISYPHTGVLVD